MPRRRHRAQPLGYLPPGRQRQHAPTVAPASDAPHAPPPLEPEPASVAFKHLQEQIRTGIWDYAQGIGYNPWQAIIALALSKGLHPSLQLECHREVAAYLLPKLASIRFEGEVEVQHGLAQPLQELFAVWEQEEEAERADLPPWIPPGIEAIDMHQGEGGAWDLDEDEGDGDAEGDDA